MAKTSIQYVCQQCGAATNKWSGRCLSCGAWESLSEMNLPTHSSRKRTASATLTPQKLSAINQKTSTRIQAGSPAIDTVLGGGFVPGSLTLISGDPGIGKSTLVLQISAHINKGQKVLYVSGEESAAQIKLRADRITGSAMDFDLVATTDHDAIMQLCLQNHYDLVIIDSIQTMVSQQLEGATGLLSQITNNTNQIARLAKEQTTTFIIIGHVTKEGNIAGPRLLEHLVDTVLYLEGERTGGFKVLRAVKNRFGSTNEVGIFEMTAQGLKEVKNPSQYLLRERQNAPGSIVLATMEGSRPLLVEVQALVSQSVFGFPKRTAAGVELNRLQLLAAVATKRGGLSLSDKDIYVNIIGGLKITEPAVDIAIILAIATSVKNITPPNDLVVFGEVGLSGEIRSVNYATARIAEAKKLGFSKILAPTTAMQSATYKPKTIATAINQLGSS